jgi:hypothetical protein
MGLYVTILKCAKLGWRKFRMKLSENQSIGSNVEREQTHIYRTPHIEETEQVGSTTIILMYLEDALFDSRPGHRLS